MDEAIGFLDDSGADPMRLFFDLLKQETPSYDFHGHDVGKPDDAAQIAELIAADLGWSETSEWVGSQVVVRNTAGKILFAVPIVEAA
jgi:hypothetical protein